MKLSAHWSNRLRELAACDSSLKWAESQESPLAAWRACEDGSWLLWAAARLGVDRRLVVQAACSCARLALPHIPEGEDRPLKAIEAAERWAAGIATIEEVRQATDAADAAAYDAASAFYATALAAASAARAANAASDATRAADAASDAATAYAASDAAAYAASDAVDTDSAYAPRRVHVNVLRQCANIVRSVISEDVMLAAWTDKEDAQ